MAHDENSKAGNRGQDPVQQPSDWILNTKLNPPLLRSDIMDRPRLIEQLDRNIQRALTLIVAPAGYGKSTLAAQWLESSSLPGAWVSLDESDNNTRTFLDYIVATVQRLHPESCTGVHDILDAPQLPPKDILATLLANDLEEISEPFLLVLDDYHLITDPDIHDLLDRLLRHPTRCFHLVLATRHDPPLSIGTMKAKGMANEIRETHLRFDSIETVQILERAGNIHLDRDDMDQVVGEIEGWIAGLRLLCLELEKGGDPRVSLVGMTGGAAHVQDYLVEQVLCRQSPDLQDYLLKSSILDRFCAPLCESVCRDSAADGGITGQQFMEAITQANLFVIQLEPGGKWLRYHHLFQDLLHNHLQRKWAPEEVAALHRQAARWFSGQGLIEEALKHARSAGDGELAAAIIEGARLTVLNNDQWPRLAMWLDSLPPGIENTHPHLLISRAHVLVGWMQVAEIPAVLDRVVQLEGETPADPMLAGELAFFRGFVSVVLAGEITKGLRFLSEAQNKLPESNLEARSGVEYMLGIALQMDGRHDQAVRQLNAAIQRKNPRNWFYQTRLVFGLFIVHVLAGKWDEASRAAGYLAELSEPNGLANMLAWAGYIQANAALHTGDLEDAERFFKVCIERCYSTNWQVAVDAFIGYALCLQLQDCPEPADQQLQKAREFASWAGYPALLDLVDSGRARLALIRGDEDAAARWLTAYTDPPQSPVKLFFLECPEITVCRVLVALGTPEKLEEAPERLNRLEEENRRFHHTCQLVTVLVIKSVLAFKTNRLQDALDSLAEAVDLAWPGRCTLPFVEAGEPVAELLARLPENPEWGSFISTARAQLSAASQPGERNDEALIDDLTNREKDVLILLCDRLYDKEIAEQLGIATATVKTHLTRAYSKLGVGNRRAAERKVKQLGLAE